MNTKSDVCAESPALVSLAHIQKEFPLAHNSRAVFVFDFDGILISNIEEQIYRLQDTADERRKLTTLAKLYSIDPQLYDTKYLRHLVYQANLWENKVLPEAGPLIKVAQELSQAGRPFFVLTARSSPAAISRAMRFLEKHRVAPQENFFVGRVAKGRQLKLLASAHHKNSLVYFDDSIRHAQNASRQKIANLTTIHIRWPKSSDQNDAKQIYDKWLKSVLERNDDRTDSAAA